MSASCEETCHMDLGRILEGCFQTMSDHSAGTRVSIFNCCCCSWIHESQWWLWDRGKHFLYILKRESSGWITSTHLILWWHSPGDTHPDRFYSENSKVLLLWFFSLKSWSSLTHAMPNQPWGEVLTRFAAGITGTGHNILSKPCQSSHSLEEIWSQLVSRCWQELVKVNCRDEGDKT